MKNCVEVRVRDSTKRQNSW
ncbi:hypothetical protein HG263_19145 [Pseudoalteromonas sp. JBTF-M23]|uniref:Uncharacterized protein n=1 Tax=Pseudoalteromonas caenipelagi TaxID=2726988 RepID=A0A849VLJ0_9GAMM|nr:hypothetical protein [Pseudoalteromonas caenipelagi]